MLDDNESLRTPRPANDNDDVGYGKPPTSQQFKPGQSGDAKGRPKGSKNKLPQFGVEQLKSSVLAEAYREIAVHEGLQAVTIPTVTVVIKKMFDKAASGDMRAAQMVIKMVQGIERENRIRLEENLQIVSDYGSWHDYEANIQSFALEPLKLFPNPNHISVNAETGDIEIAGPINADEQKQLDENLGIGDDSKHKIPKRVLSRRSKFPKGSWNDELFLTEAKVSEHPDAEETFRAEPPKQDDAHVKTDLGSGSNKTEAALNLVVRDASTPRPTSALIAKLRSEPQFK